MQFLSSHLYASLSVHLPPPFTNHNKPWISLVLSVPLSFSSQPTPVQSLVHTMQFLLSHLSHCLLVSHLPPLTNQYKPCNFSCSICPALFHSSTHHHKLTSTNHAVSIVPSAPLSLNSPPTNILLLVQTMQLIIRCNKPAISSHTPGISPTQHDYLLPSKIANNGTSQPRHHFSRQGQ
jgi:hypothetical protein